VVMVRKPPPFPARTTRAAPLSITPSIRPTRFAIDRAQPRRTDGRRRRPRRKLPPALCRRALVCGAVTHEVSFLKKSRAIDGHRGRCAGSGWCCRPGGTAR
jgi:hypothetical protein